MNSLITPVYFVQPNRNEITLGTGPIEILHKLNRIRGSGAAKLRLLPDFRISIDGHFSDSAEDVFTLLSAGKTVEMIFGRGFEHFGAIITDLSVQTENSSLKAEASFEPSPQRLVFRNDSETSINSLVFHIINFPIFLNANKTSGDISHQKPSGGWQRIGRIVLESHQWQIEIQELPETKEVISRLKETGGYGITHVGQLKRKDANRFTPDAAEMAIQDLYLFLSFARGAWTPPVLSVGYDAAGSKVYEDWGIRISTPWESRRGWFDAHHADSLSVIYPKFLSLLRHPILGKATANALYWYLRSNRGGEGAGIDSGIILSQAALERLSTAYLAQEKSNPKKLGAAGSLRTMLERLDVPREIPAVLANLWDGQQRGLWKDGPEAVTKVRNELIHPRGRLPIKIGSVIPDTWSLAQWYIELILLRLSKYNGSYSNRLSARWVGEVENVPWAVPLKRKIRPSEQQARRAE